MVPNWVGSGVLLSPKTHMPDQKVLIWAKMVCGNMTVNTFLMFGALLICTQFGSQFRGRFGGHFGVPNWVGLGSIWWSFWESFRGGFGGPEIMPSGLAGDFFFVGQVPERACENLQKRSKVTEGSPDFRGN